LDEVEAVRFKWNRIIHGDCLEVMKTFSGSMFDMVYIDPPFFTQRVLKGVSGSYMDKWRNQEEYLTFIREVLLLVKYVLSFRGSLYYHCDYRTNYLVRPLLEKLFKFHNELIWVYKGGAPRTGGKSFVRKHDTIYFVTRTDDYIFNVDAIRIPYADSSKDLYKRKKIANIHGKSYKWKMNPKGKYPEDVIYAAPMSHNLSERIGYPTQKPEVLLETFIKASTNINDIVLDPFCGSGTMLNVAKRLRRRFIGIDRNREACEISANRVFGDGDEYERS